MTPECILPFPVDPQGNITPEGRRMHRLVSASIQLEHNANPDIPFAMSKWMVRKAAGIKGYESRVLKEILGVEKLPPTETIAIHLQEAGVPYWLSLPKPESNRTNGHNGNGEIKGAVPLHLYSQTKSIGIR